MNIPLKELRGLTTQELTRLGQKYPKVADGLKSLDQRALARLAGDDIEYESLDTILDNIVEEADELEQELGDAAGGYVMAAAQDLTVKLEDLAKQMLGKGVPVLPELAVKLALAETVTRPGQTALPPKPGCRTKLGGKPDWLQNNETPICSGCKRPLTFVAQIDSLSVAENELGRVLSEQGSYMFADVGMIYVFWCTKCNETASVLQCG